ncbi:MAG: FAD/NAD(P)-binding protein [Candidatus Marinimicrobia bacterium]|nr:FAD/NAD(P)-binding protein [Candidatus Neomarinimicrobiota bacterium]MCF7922693.1 FAD/NAD(P)-binding protein [Candidatus Neomarinimicrobiota bacterium]
MKRLQDVEPQQTEDLYYPTMCKVTRAKQITEMEKWYELEMPDGKSLGHHPGQFVEVSAFGIGEAPISVSSSPSKKGTFELCIRQVGTLTNVLKNYEPGDLMGIRGPFGKGFPMEKLFGKDILVIAGGIGLVPLRSLINYVIDNRQDFGRLIILYGAKTPAELLFTDELKAWETRDDVELHVTVDQPDASWKGHTGVITTLIPALDLKLNSTIAAVTGPPIMYKFVVMSLKSKQLPDDQIYLSLERRMKCGVGKCGHCQINGVYCCQDGPVFNYVDLKPLEEAL